MKKISFLLLLSILAAQLGFAAPRSYKQAKAIALQKAESLGISNSGVALSKQSPAGDNVDGKAYYLFDNGGGNGFVIVSGDDRLPDVIGYATKGSLSEGEMPIQLKSLLDSYEKNYAEIVGDNAKLESITAERMALANTLTASNTVVQPLLGDIAWGQDTPYNNLCPKIDGKNALTGCVATAMSQVMKYFKYPTKLQADIPGYSANGITLPKISVSETQDYDYSNMLDSYLDSYTTDQASAVATLMYHCGCAVQMGYSLTFSGAYTSYTPVALGTYFGYDTKTLAYINRIDYTLSEWCQIIDHELANNRPIIYSGHTSDNSGHAFVCDGSDGNGFYHINWGWQGYWNGYFDISLLNSDEAGSTSGADGFNYDMGMVIGIMPSTTSGNPPLATAKILKADVNTVNLSTSTRSDSNGSFSGNADVQIYNYSNNDFNGYLALAVKGESVYTQIPDTKTEFSLNNHTSTQKSLSFNYTFPVGTTKVYVVFGSDDGNLTPCAVNTKKPYFYVNATDKNATIESKGYSLSATITGESVLYTGSNDLNLSVTNSGVDDYFATVKVYSSSTTTKPGTETSKLQLTVPANGDAQRKVTISPESAGSVYIWVDDVDGNSLIAAKQFTVEERKGLVLISMTSNAVPGEYETDNAYYKGSANNPTKVKAPKTYDDAAKFTFVVKNTGTTIEDRTWKLKYTALNKSYGIDAYKEKIISRTIDAGETSTFTITVTPEDIDSRFIACEIRVQSLDNELFYEKPACSLEKLTMPIIDSEYSIGLGETETAVYVADKTPIDTYTDNNVTYWATYSNQSADVELSVPSDRTLTLYNVKVTNGQMTLVPRTEEYAQKVAKGEAVLIKTDGATVDTKALGGSSNMTKDSDNDLIATPAAETTLEAGTGKVFYRLTYRNATKKTYLGFYISVVSGEANGSRIKVAPGKGYLEVAKSEATEGSAYAPAKAFLLGDGNNTTTIECITVSNTEDNDENAEGRIFNLQGQQVKKPVNGIYIVNNKKVIIK